MTTSRIDNSGTPSDRGLELCRLHRFSHGDISLEDLLQAVELDERKVSLHPMVPRSKIWFGKGSAEVMLNSNDTLVWWRSFRVNHFAYSFVILIILSALAFGFVWPALLSILSQNAYDIIWIIVLSLLIVGGGGAVLVATWLESIFPPSAVFSHQKRGSGGQSTLLSIRKVAYVWPSLKISRSHFEAEAVIVVRYYRPLLKQVPLFAKNVSLYAAFFVSRSMECFQVVGAESPVQCVSDAQHLLRMAGLDESVVVLDFSDKVDITIMPR